MKERIWQAGIFCLLAGPQVGAIAQDDQAMATRDDGAKHYWKMERVEFNPLAGAALSPTPNPSAPRARSTAMLTIQNETLEIRWNSRVESLTVVSKSNGSVVLTNVSFNQTGSVAGVSRVSDEVFGAGNQLELNYANGNRDTVALYPGLPFALFRSTIRNPGTEPVVIRSVRPLHLDVQLGHPISQLKTLGTAGLLPPGRDPGSYEWLAVAEPRTRNSVVIGLLTHDRGDGVFFSQLQGEVVRVGAQIDYGRLRIMPGNTAELETCAVGYFEDGRLGLEAWADAVAKRYAIKLPPQPVGYCTWYSKPHGGASDEASLAEQAAFAAENLAGYGFSVVQIDDGWQAGFKRPAPRSSPKKDFTRHNPAGPYRAGMKSAADNIKAKGLVPGIWFMPFAGTMEDPFFVEHPDWFVRTSTGRPYDVPWGGTSLDMTHPAARSHLREVTARITHEWGFQYLKVDGLWTGTATSQLYVNSGYKEDDIGEAIFHDPAKSNIEAYRDGLKLLREAAGHGVFILGCNGPQNMRSYGGAFGLVDGMRVGPDNGAEWKGLTRGPVFGSRHYFLHRRVWYNDPDPVYVRSSMPLTHAQLIASWVALSDQLNLSSEWFPGLPPERLDILKRTMPYHNRTARPVDFFEHDPARVWIVSDTAHKPRRDVIGLYNWSDSEEHYEQPLASLGLAADADYDAFDYWGNKLLTPIHGQLRIAVPGQSCRVLAVRARQKHPQVISTSRHLTQGMIDVLSEEWNGAQKTLTGRSQTIAGDPYELRIAGNAIAENVRLATDDEEHGVTSTVTTANGLTRVKIHSPETRVVWWTITFE